MATKTPSIPAGFKMDAAERLNKNAELMKNPGPLYDRLSEAKTAIMTNRNTGFMVGEVFRVPISFNPENEHGTMTTDGKSIEIDPLYWTTINLKQKIWSLSHETFHRIFLHLEPHRRGKREHMLWNIAGDCFINASLAVMGVGESVKGTIESNQYGTIGLNINGKALKIEDAHKMSTEDIYELLIQHAKKNPPKNKGQSDIITDSNGNEIQSACNQVHGKLTEEDVKDIKESVRQMACDGKLRGNMPNWLEARLDAMLENKVDWRSELRELVTPEIKAYMTFNRTNRRSCSLGSTLHGLSLPGMKKEGLEIGIGIDCSGSMTDENISYILGEIRQIFMQFEQDTVHCTVYMHDVQVFDKFELYSEHDIKKITIKSRGGTSHKNVFACAEEDNIKALILFTDGYSEFPEYTTVNKILWICIDKDGAAQIPSNLGKIIEVNLAE